MLIQSQLTNIESDSQVQIKYESPMPKSTPFYSCLEPLNRTGVWKKWAGYLVAAKFQASVTTEYYAIRNGVSVFDTSPLFKYHFTGTQAIDVLRRALVRDVADCEVGQAQYTAWCDENGFVVQDGVVIRVSDDEFLLTAAEPSLRYFRRIAGAMGLSDCRVEDVSASFGVLAVQGPLSCEVLCKLAPAVSKLGFFEVANTEIAGRRVWVSRTGFTGDLGYEIWVRAEHAAKICEKVLAAGADCNIIPIGSDALKIARLEAGLLLMDVDFESARYAWVDAQRETPVELGWAWMLKNLSRDGRDFIGRDAIEKELQQKTNRWRTVGLEIDWHDYERVHREAGIPTPKYEHYHEGTFSIYRPGSKQWDYAGYATSFLFSSLLKKTIAIAKLPNDLASVGTEVNLELSVIRKPVNVLGRVTRMPFFNPVRKTQMPDLMIDHPKAGHVKEAHSSVIQTDVVQSEGK